MARTFTNGNSTRLYNTSSAPVTAPPLTLACWFKPTGNVFNALVSVGVSGSNDNRFTLNVQDIAGGQHVTAQARSTFNAIAASSNTWTSNVWQHACARFTSTTARYALLNGGGSGTDTNFVDPAGANSIYVGANMGLNANGFTGDICDVGVWNVALNDGEILALASGVSPLRIRPQSLVFYAPIFGDASPEPDYSGGGRNLTLNGSPPVAAHAPVMAPFTWQVAPWLVTPTAGTHSLTANGIDAGAPTAGTPTLGAAHALTATGISTGAPAAGTPAMGQTHALTATAIDTGAAVVATPSLGQVHKLTADGISTGTPSVGSPALGQASYSLTATGITTGTPTAGTPALGQGHALSAAAISTGIPAAGSPTLGQVHALPANGATAGTPSLGTPVLTLRVALTAVGVAAGTPTAGTPALSQVHALMAVDVATGQPVVGGATLGQVHVLTAMALSSGTPECGTPFLIMGAWVVPAERTWVVASEVRVHDVPAGARVFVA